MTELPGGMRRGQVAKRLDISPIRVQQLADEGRIDFVITALGRLYRPESVERLAAERAERAARDPRVRMPAMSKE